MMAHFAEIDVNNIVLRVLVVPDEQEHRGQEFVADDLGLGGTWIQTSYNNNIRKQYAGIGYSYDAVNDVFIAPQPAPWFVLNETFDWVCPEGINPATGEQYTEDEMLLIDLSSRVYAGINLSEVPL
jgi:hypothetical protein